MGSVGCVWRRRRIIAEVLEDERGMCVEGRRVPSTSVTTSEILEDAGCAGVILGEWCIVLFLHSIFSRIKVKELKNNDKVVIGRGSEIGRAHV